MLPKAVALVLRILGAVFLMGCGCLPLSTFPVKFQSGKTYRYSYSTDTTVNELINILPHSHQARADVGFRFTATVELTSVWTTDSSENLIKLAIVDPSLQSTSRSQLTRELRTLPRLPIYFHWHQGSIKQVFVGDDDTTLAVNIKKGIVSLLQLRVEDGSHAETDTSGDCEVVYLKTGGTTMTKTKSNCKTIEDDAGFSQVNQLFGVSVTSSSEVEYTIFDDVIKSAIGQETWTTRLNAEETLSLNVKQHLRLTEAVESGIEQQTGPFEDVLNNLGKDKDHNLFGTSLKTVFEPRQCTGRCAAVSDIVAQFRKDLTSTRIGTGAASRAFRELVQTFRSAPKDAILNILKEKNNEKIILSLIDVAVAAQTSASLEALTSFLNFNKENDLELLERYLLATALSTHPSEQVILDLLKKFNTNFKNEKLRESIGEALGAVTYTYCRQNGHQQKIVSEVEEAFAEKLEKCKDSACQLMILRSLSNAGTSGTLDVIMKIVESSKYAAVSEAGLRALRRIDKKEIASKVREKLKDIFHQRKRGYDTTVRSQALAMILEIDPTLEEIRDILLESTDPWNTDYDLYIQSLLFNAAQQNNLIQSLVKDALRNTTLNNYHILSPKGKSLAFTSLLTERPSTTTYFMYVENSRSGIMKRSGMDVDAWNRVQKLPLYSFGIFAAGLEGLIGDGVDASEKDVEVTAGIALDMVGVSLRPITFFTGQGGLMSAIWSAPSELVSALQANFLLQDHSERIRLQNGLIAELDVQVAVSVDMSGSVSVSLWNKNAESLIKNSGALLVESSLTIDTSSFKTGINFSEEGESNIDFRTDVDFSDGIQMCLQMSRPDILLKQKTTRYENDRGLQKTYMARINRTLKSPAISFPLPGANAVNCRILIQN